MSSRPHEDDKKKPKRGFVKGKSIQRSFLHIPMEMLYAYLDQHLEPDEEKSVLSHLNECDKCKNLLKEAYVVLKGLDNYAEKNHRECPSPETMRDLEMGKLSKSETLTIEKHLSECPYCIEFEKLYKHLEQESQDKG
jgi:predicted anti-sigma-YlaC factor YlaD